MARQINPTLFDKLVADLDLSNLREEVEAVPDVEVSRSSMRFYAVPRIERFNEKALRVTVLRELNWILNTTNLSSTTDLAPYPHVATSVLNYGVSDMAGKLLQRRGVQTRAREIREAILRFEPRMDPRRLDVDAAAEPERPHAITFTIRGDVTSTVKAMPVEFKTDVEIDTGDTTLRD